MEADYFSFVHCIKAILGRGSVILMKSRFGVFLSATRNDLRPCCLRVAEVINRFGAYPIGMESFNASRRNALQLCYDKVQEAEIFIGIYAHRYGYAPKSNVAYKTLNGEIRRGDGETSITHWEYLWAVERNLPILCFLISDTDEGGKPLKWASRFIEKEPAKSRLETFKSIILENHTVSFFYSPDRLASLVAPALSDALQDLGKKRLFETSIDPSTIFVLKNDQIVDRQTVSHDFIPDELPEKYVARDALVSEIKATLLSDAEALVLTSSDHLTPRALHGMGGIGKTVVARALCEDKTVKAAFPDGILWATLGKEITEVEISDKLRGWISNLNGAVSESAPTLESLRVSLARLLEEKACLLVVDNVWSKEHTEIFRVGGKRCCLLLTTRDAQIGKLMGAEIHTIPVMSEDEAVNLLERWSKGGLRSTSYALKLEIVNRLGRLPLAVKLAGAQMAEIDPQLWSKQFEQLRDLDVEYSTDDPEKSVHVCFKMSIEALTSQVRELYFSLGVFRQNEAIPEEAIRVLWIRLAQLRPQAVRRVMRDLSDKALLDLGQEATSATLHDLLRKYIDDQVEGKTEELHQTLLDAYRQTCTGSGWHTLPQETTYIFDHLVYHLKATHNYPELKSLFDSSAWMEVRVPQRKFSYYCYINDLMTAWIEFAYPAALQQLKNGEDITAIADCVRYALIRTSINSIADNHSPEIIAATLEKKVWTFEQALNTAMRIPDLAQRVKAYVAILEIEVLSEEQKHRVYSLFFDTYVQLENDYAKLQSLEKLALIIDSKYVERAFDLIQGLPSLQYLGLALIAFAPKVSEEKRIQGLRDYVTLVLENRAFFHISHLLQRLMPYFPDDQVERLFETLSTVDDASQRSSLICAVSSRLSPTQVTTAFRFAQSITKGKERAEAINSLAELLPPTLAKEAIEAVEDVDEIYTRIKALVDLSKLLEEPDRRDVLNKVMGDLQKDNNSYTHTTFPMQTLYEKLPLEFQLKAIDLCLDTGMRLGSGWHRSEAFGWALFRLCDSNLFHDREEAFDHGFYNLLHLGECNSLINLLPHLPQSYAQLALQKVTEVTTLPPKDDEVRQKQAEFIGRILPFVDADRRPLFHAMVERIFLLPDKAKQLAELDGAAKNLNSDELRTVLGQLRLIEDRRSQIAALARISQHFPETQCEAIAEQILQVIPELTSDPDRAYALASIAPISASSYTNRLVDLSEHIHSEMALSAALANIAHSCSQPPVDRIFEVAINLSEEDAKVQLLNALSSRLSPQQIDQCLDFVLSLKGFKPKSEILVSCVPNMSYEQRQKVFESARTMTEPLIGVFIGAIVYPYLEKSEQESFIADSLHTIFAADILQAKYGIVLAITSILPLVTTKQRTELLGYALHVVVSMSADHAAYPSGNPKANIIVELAPHLNEEMLDCILAEIQEEHYVPGSDENPRAHILSAAAQTFTDRQTIVVLDLLGKYEDSWDKTEALEEIGSRIPNEPNYFERFLELGSTIAEPWQQARTFLALYNSDIEKNRTLKLIRESLLQKLFTMKDERRDQLLWSVDVRLYKEPFLTLSTLTQIVDSIDEICNQWQWL